MNENLSRIVADLFANAKGGEELTSKIQRLRGEIKKVIEREDAIFGKFLGLVESFREIMPEEKLRYNTAIKALSTTSKISPQEIVKAVNKQLEELKILEKGLMPALPAWRDELKAMEARSQAIRDEIAKAREKIAQIESEEKGVLSGMAAREQEMKLVEKAVGELFTDIGAEITAITKKVAEFTAERAAPLPVPQPVPQRDAPKSDVPVEEEEDTEQESEIEEPPAQEDTEFQKKCPMCGGRMDFYGQEKLWQCYSCAYEESAKDDVQGERKEAREQTNVPKPAPASGPGSEPSRLRAVHMGFPSSGEDQPKKGSSPFMSQPSSKKKTCPVCRKKMDWFPMEKAWRCSFCDYERSI